MTKKARGAGGRLPLLLFLAGALFLVVPPTRAAAGTLLDPIDPVAEQFRLDPGYHAIDIVYMHGGGFAVSGTWGLMDDRAVEYAVVVPAMGFYANLGMAWALERGQYEIGLIYDKGECMLRGGINSMMGEEHGWGLACDFLAATNELTGALEIGYIWRFGEHSSLLAGLYSDQAWVYRTNPDISGGSGLLHLMVDEQVGDFLLQIGAETHLDADGASFAAELTCTCLCFFWGGIGVSLSGGSSEAPCYGLSLAIRF